MHKNPAKNPKYTISSHFEFARALKTYYIADNYYYYNYITMILLH